VSVPSRSRQFHQAQERVRQWLDCNVARYLSQRDDLNLPLDFVVYSPVSFGLELRHLSSTHRPARRAKRDFAARIDLVDHFGPELPLVVVAVGDGANFETLRLLADAVYQLDALPPIEELRSLRIDSEIRDFLRRGAPRGVMITELELLERTWSNSLALNELVDRQDFPPTSLAYRLHEAVHELLRHLREGEAAPKARRSLTSRARPSSQNSFAEPPSPVDVLLQEHEFYFEKLVTQRAVELIGGRVDNHRINLSSLRGNQLSARLPIWRLANGCQIALRRFAANDFVIDHKVRELIAEAWLLRAADALVDPQLYLLLTDTRRAETQQESAKARSSSISRGLLQSINRFESAGWQVFPWDFAEDEPVFIQAARALLEARQ
jgi:hypothetical protein